MIYEWCICYERWVTHFFHIKKKHTTATLRGSYEVSCSLTFSKVHFVNSLAPNWVFQLLWGFVRYGGGNYHTNVEQKPLKQLAARVDLNTFWTLSH